MLIKEPIPTSDKINLQSFRLTFRGKSEHCDDVVTGVFVLILTLIPQARNRFVPL